MTQQPGFFSVWSQDSNYWLVVEGANATTLEGFKPIHHKNDLAAHVCGAHWSETWARYADALIGLPGGLVGHRAAVIASETLPALPDIQSALKPISEVNAISTNLWLIDSINNGQLDCYMQRVLDRRGKVVGFEAFARMESTDGGVIGGGAIMQAAHALKVEYQLDRVLHKQAVDCFVGSDLQGYLFINFLTGFIHRPEVYLDGLSQAVSKSHMLPASVVLDVPLTDYAKDMGKLKSIAAYCASRGFALALDDVTSSGGLANVIEQIKPGFVKLDRKFGENMNPAKANASLQEIVRLCHANGVTVLAEGVESTVQHANYLAAEVDMFQGYLFGAPERFAKASSENKAALTS